MQTTKNRFRWTALTLLVLLVAAVGCERDGLDWQEATSASGNYVIEFPGQPNTETTPKSLRLTDLDADTGYYALVEIPLNGMRPRSLDSAVDASVEDGRAKVESGRNTPVTATEISRTTGDFEGVETRKYRVNLAGDGFKFALNGLVFYRNDFMVRALVSSDADIDPGLAEHFLSSLKASPEP